ncbi:hypothetical protein B0T25DRAFT_123582 [Lasiosphaeria hispida]|uniref:Pentatricopeptide repeat protein n=1 Tax=Lasiosphaeria hispida TaxID=260671 RepID=A0AAJ0HRT1_9PEZI|nr:hypothetical protein B0T25DRAFT_123582 [Lasiosphaeria hispida]
MSLGVKQLWRVLPQPHGTRGLSLIPRETLAPVSLRPRHPLHPLQTSTYLLRAYSSWISKPKTDPERYPKPKPKDDPSGFEKPKPSLLVTKPAPPPVSSLLDRLAGVPVRPHGPRESILVPPITEYPNRNETFHSIIRHQKALRRQAILRNPKYGKRRIVPADWRWVLQFLIRSTPDYLPPKTDRTAVTVTIPGWLDELLNPVSEKNLWKIMSQTGCDMTVAPVEDDEDPFVTVSGRRAAVDAAITAIRLIDDLLIVTPAPHPGGTETLTTTHPLSLNRRCIFDVKADRIPRPREWTDKTFDEYVTDLTTSRMGPGIAHELYTDADSHEEAVVRQLNDVFREPEMTAVVSHRALNTALSFMAKRDAFYRCARDLVNYMHQAGQPPDAHTFCILLEMAAKGGDMREFQIILRQMMRRGCSPPLRAWILFLRMVEAEEVKRYVMHYLHGKGLLNMPGAVGVVANEMAAADAYRAVQLGYDVKTFVAKQNALYGEEWLTRDSGNKVLNVLGCYGKFDEAFDFLGIMWAKKTPLARPGAVSLTTVITHCKMYCKFDTAVKFLQLFEEHRAPPPNAIVCHMLFMTAWRMHTPHILGVVWQYANRMGNTSHVMRSKAIRLLDKDEQVNILLSRFYHPKGMAAYAADEKTPGNAGKGGVSPTPVEGLDMYQKRTFVNNLLLSDFKANGSKGPTDQCGQNVWPWQRYSENMPWRDILINMRKFYTYWRNQGGRPTEQLSTLLKRAQQLDRELEKRSLRGLEIPLEALPVHTEYSVHKVRHKVRVETAGGDDVEYRSLLDSITGSHHGDEAAGKDIKEYERYLKATGEEGGGMPSKKTLDL